MVQDLRAFLRWTEGRADDPAVDTPGRLPALRVTPANAQERDQVAVLATAVQAATGDAVKVAFVDQGYTGDEPAAAAIRRSIPAKMSRCTGYMRYQYARPPRPTGSKIAVCRIVDPAPSAATSNSSQARPGTFISAARRRRRFGSIASTRHQSSASPTRSPAGSRRPRRIPTPPTSTSRNPRRRHSQVA